MERPECFESKSVKTGAHPHKKFDVVSPVNQSSSGPGWFNKLQHKLKFKNQVQEECTPVESKIGETKDHYPSRTPQNELQHLSLASPKESEFDEHPLAPRSQRSTNMSTKMIKDRILDRKRKV